jgi:hypothetical protein
MGTMAATDRAASLARLRTTPRDLVSLLTGVSPERLRRRPGDGRPDGAAASWSPAMVVSHLADAELVYSVRIRMVLTDDRPYLAAFDERAWVERFSGLEAEPKQALTRWRMLRDANLRLLESLDEADWDRTGLHPEHGEMTVASIAGLLAAHDRDHLDQIRQALAA